MRKLLLVAAAVLVLVALAGVAGYNLLSRAAPGQFALGNSPAPTTASPSPSGSPDDPRLRLICANLGPPSSVGTCLAEARAFMSACTFPAGTRAWVIETGSEAGMRVHERFFQLQSPHVAVARTSDVAGGMVASGAGPAFKVESACVAVSTLTLQSVDTVPGMDTSQRDGTIADVLAALRFPVATFKTRQPLPVAGGDDGRKHQLKVVGEFTVHGATRVVTATLEAVILGRRAEVVGSFPIKLRDYGMAPPENPIAAVDSTVTIELHVFLDRT